MPPPTLPALRNSSMRKDLPKMRKFKATMVGLFCLAAVTGCTTNTSSVSTTFNTKPVLQLSVGTINDIPGTLQAQTGTCGAAGPYVDVIETFRNQNGTSAFIHPGNATLTPGTGPNNVGPSQYGIGIFAYGQNFQLNSLPAAAPAWAAPG